MKRRNFLLLAVGLMLCLSSGSSFAQTKTHRVLFALLSGDASDWQVTIGNINNLIKGLAPEEVEIEVVAYSQGLGLVKNGSSMAKEVAELQEKHVKFVACQNAMRMQHVEAKDLLPGVGMVPAGIVEVVTKQEQGWTYIKAGR
jgi:intracellular sulfur oxidation DsrE/DsrF family protein